MNIEISKSVVSAVEGVTEIHISCEHGKQYCPNLKTELEKSFKDFDPEFTQMPENKQIRDDEGTLIKLKNVSTELLENIAEQSSNVSCVHKVRA